MAFRIARGQTAEAFLRSVARAQMMCATKAVERQLDEEAGADAKAKDVHSARRVCKRLRALVRLVSPSSKEAAAVDRLFRNAAKELAVMRDAHVCSITLGGVIATLSARQQPRDLQWLKDQFQTRDSAASLAVEKDREIERAAEVQRWKKVRRNLRRSGEKIASWEFARQDFAAFRSGILRTYKQARDTLKVAERAGGADLWHEFRKYLKYHSIQIRLLAPLCPPILNAHASAAAEVADLLGRDHDLAILDLHLEKLATRTADEISADRVRLICALRSLISSEQKNLRRKSSALAGCILCELPKEFTSRAERYWNRWRAE